ncbi:MAG: hypothetical protein EP329_24095 [Deltaproteobacteria bacterium]|nr:MAG: hypothetical protein EP329_24095 [Deltaproteobacteria bacterium]
MAGILGIAASAVATSGCLSGDAAVAPTGRVSIAVAPLELPGVSDADYTITVTNQVNEVVWTRALASSRYGDGAGSLSYVGPCDADEPLTTITLVLDALYGPGGAELPAGSWANPTPVTLQALCVAGADVPVTFDMTISRAAQQGFFDVAVTFGDVFCSAKLDCAADTGGDLDLLYNPGTEARDMTAVLGLACAADATGGPTYLYLDDPVITCTGLAEPVRVDAGASGNVDLTVAPNANPGGYLFGASVYRGGQPGGVAYWNISLGLDDTAFVTAGDCTVSGRATASSEPFPQTLDGFPLPEASVYPVITWSAPLSTAAGRACTRHALDDPDGRVATEYLGFLTAPNQFTWSDTVIALRHRYAPATGEVLGPLDPGGPTPFPSCFADSVRPDEASYPRVLHVARWGVDATADGTETAPYRRLDLAIAAASTGDAIHIHPGVYRLVPMDGGSSGLYDMGKSLHVFGDNDETILEVYGPDSTARDYNVFRLQGASTVVSNLLVHYWPTHGNNYSNAIMRFSSGTSQLRNLAVIHKGSQNWSYIYDNNNTGGPDVFNCLFVSNGLSTSDYSGTPTYTKTLFDATPTRGTRTDTLTRTVTPADRWLSSLPADLLDPLGGAAHIGPGGGTYLWDTCCPPDGGADGDGDGHPDSCDVCPQDVGGDSDDDGVCASDDVCPWGADGLDADGDGAPDACDLCPDDATNRCAYLPNPADYPTVWNVATWGDDVGGDGSALAPFASLHVAVAAAASGDGIYVWPGRYHTVMQTAGGSTQAGVYDAAKALHIWGANEHTLLEVYGAESALRDGNAVVFKAGGSVLSNLTVLFYPGKTTNYSNALFSHWVAGGSVRNVRFENRSPSIKWAYSYDNNSSGAPWVYNCVFEAHALQYSDYSGAPHYFSSLFSATPTAGTKTGCVTRATTTADWYWPSMPVDLRNAGDPTLLDVDGTPSSVGTGGGSWPWNTDCPPDGTLDSDGDGHPDHCDPCPADPLGDLDGDGLCD